ncbi:MAG: ATP-binding protein [Synergistaceae bacterium]|nr:ATP-binding protein [Synergistaceae bacterium]
MNLNLIFYELDELSMSVLNSICDEQDGGVNMSRLINTAIQNNFSGNLYQNFLAFIILNNINPFSLSCERGVELDDTIKQLAMHDCEIFFKLFKISSDKNFNFNLDNSSLIGAISKTFANAASPEELFNLIKNFYETQGVGSFGFHRAFRLNTHGENFTIEPIISVEDVSLSDITGYEIQKRELRANTDAFIAGRPANNVLLYGDSGTGKSTSIKALLNDYKNSKLKIIEIYKHQFKFLPDLIARIKGRNYKFIIFIDDLSFEESETEYKFLKAAIEGGLEVRPNNILIYATSNRRHIVREVWRDRDDMEHSGDIHRSDTLEEKLSLASRFGVAINYSSPSRNEYHEIIKNLAKKSLGNYKDINELLKGADAWEIRHGGKSGRAARQYIDYLAGKSMI